MLLRAGMRLLHGTALSEGLFSKVCIGVSEWSEVSAGCLRTRGRGFEERMRDLKEVSAAEAFSGGSRHL